jgi:hypothetical protein
MNSSVVDGRKRRRAMVRLLIKNGAGLEERGDYREIALACAAAGEYEAAVQLLANQGSRDRSN